MTRLLSCLFFTSTFFFFGTLGETVTINTRLGKVAGNVVENKYEFLGLRYSNPMLGNKRFRQAEEYETQYNGTYNATSYPCGCNQWRLDVSIPCISEDCLFLNIFTSDYTGSLPVMIFIHGGSFIYGSGSEESFHGINFIDNNGNNKVVLVTINYRLGPLGFLQSSQLSTEDLSYPSYGGMNGLYDQIVSIKWVINNIKDYGGNPNEITIFGESAGGLSVSTLLIMEKAGGLFQRAIVESGPSRGPWGPRTFGLGITQTNSALERCGYENNITYLRTLDAQEFTHCMEGPFGDDGFGPSVDNYLLTAIPTDIYDNIKSSNEINAQSIIWGFNSQDGLAGWPWNVGNSPDTSDEYKSDLKVELFYLRQKTSVFQQQI